MRTYDAWFPRYALGNGLMFFCRVFSPAVGRGSSALSTFLDRRTQRVNDALTPGNHQKGQGLFIDIALVLARPFQSETILFRWMKMETMQLLFVQSLLNRSSDLSDPIKLTKIRLFIHSKLEPKINKIFRNS